MTSFAYLILTNARVLTMEAGQPTAEAVALTGEIIVGVGSCRDMAGFRGPRTRVIDCRGLTLLPGFVDAHCHLLAQAASLMGVDCGPDSVASIKELERAIAHRAGSTAPGYWIRGFGYDDLALIERRHLTRWDLDRATPDHPVRLDHRSGHATAFNSLGLARAGIHRDTPDPVEGVIVRDQVSGEPTGLLLELAGFIRQRLGNVREEAEFQDGVARLNRLLLQYGITSVLDAGPNNDPDRWNTFQGLTRAGLPALRVTMMAGATKLAEFQDAGLGWGSGDDDLRLGHAKLMLTMTTGSMHPSNCDLEETVARCHRLGFPVAIHAVEQEAVQAAADAIRTSPSIQMRAPGDPRELDCGRELPFALEPAENLRPRDRIEHCSECPPELLELVKVSGAVVVTQPGFIYWNGDGYLERGAPELTSCLYSVGGLVGRGVPVAFGSDAPVTDPSPWHGVYSAVTRYTRAGNRLPSEQEQYRHQRVSVLSALRMYTLAGAFAEGSETRKGSICVGKLADLVLVDADPREVPHRELLNIRGALTVLGGRVVWGCDP